MPKVWLMREPGQLEDFVHLEENGLKISDMVWHKNRLWVATLNKGIWGYDESAAPVCQINASNGLPPGDVSLKLAFRDDRMFASGRFGSPGRSWIAEIRNYNDDASVDLIYEARKVPENSHKYTPLQLGYAFTPTLLCAGPDIPPFNNGAGAPSIWVSANGTRLVVNLRDRSVSIKQAKRLNRMSIESRSHYLRFENELISVKDVRSFDKVGKRRLILSVRVAEGMQGFVTFNGKHYLPGHEDWYRVDIGAMEIESLTDSSLPHVGALVFASSANYGIVGWEKPYRGTNWFRVSISDEAVEEPASQPKPRPVIVPAVRPARPPIPYLSGDSLPEKAEPLIDVNIQTARKFASDLGKPLPDGAIRAYCEIRRFSDWLPPLSGALWMDPPERRKDHCLYFVNNRLVRCQAFQQNDFHYPPKTETAMEIGWDDSDRPVY
ncbi:MAG: hypothetical protein AAF497_12550, partial [Planctomycetota bacterium]